MTSVSCPLCGKYTSITSFDPGSLDDDIYAVSFRGLGRGRGFKVTEKRSLLDSLESEETVSAIADRTLQIAKFLRDEGTISDKEIIKAVGLNSLLTSEKLAENLVSKIGEVLDEDPDDWDIEDEYRDDGDQKEEVKINIVFQKLDYGITKLLAEYEALRESSS